MRSSSGDGRSPRGQAETCEASWSLGSGQNAVPSMPPPRPSKSRGQAQSQGREHTPPPMTKPWQGRGCKEGEELGPVIQSTTKGRLPPSGHTSPTILVTTPRRVHVSCNLSFIDFAQSTSRRLLLSPFYSYSSTPLFQILSGNHRGKKNLFFFFFIPYLS